MKFGVESMVRTIYCLCILLLWSASAYAAGPSNRMEIEVQGLVYDTRADGKLPADAVALIETKDAEGNPLFKGTAFTLGNGRAAVTRYHVIMDAHSAKLTFPDGEEAPVEGVVGVNRAKDMALLRLSTDAPSYMKEGRSKVGVGDGVSVVGYPYGVHKKVEGRIVARGYISGMGGEEILIVLESPLGPGASGGPVMDADGNVVAVVGSGLSAGAYEIVSLMVSQVRKLHGKAPPITLSELASQDRGDPYHLYHLGNLFEYQGLKKSAMDYYRNSLKINPDYPPAHLALGLLYRRAGKLQKAKEHYREALRIKPDYGYAHNNLGVVYGMQEMVEQEMAHYLEALKINPLDAEAHNNLGEMLMRIGRIEQALREYQVALNINPNLAPARRNLAMAYRKITFPSGPLD